MKSRKSYVNFRKDNLPDLQLEKLPRSFYLRPTITVAKDLLGKYLVRKYNNQLLTGKIVEVEAYLGEKDPASHAFRGQTKRNEVMFWEGGHLYVYFTYGMHYCCNVVTEEKGKGRAILLRAIEPVKNIEAMQNFRNIDITKNMINLTNGPAKVCQAFMLGREENGTDLCGDKIWIGTTTRLTSHDSHLISGKDIISSPRVGITNGSKHKWRFYIKENPWVSKK
ncbi:MAG: DNA-3-methyladenine glycosylase [Bacteroidota bacterium]|nr:DNA-3-methyladenine glycosylase [Bacteroidota bacterium]MBU1423844.1 DNA-3-methyladenine glycosylase [Bacteroidota bacterium]MDI6779500.1 DNA-3-methyladenine glycosylase [Bacteroidota bacterium]